MTLLDPERLRDTHQLHGRPSNGTKSSSTAGGSDVEASSVPVDAALTKPEDTVAL